MVKINPHVDFVVEELSKRPERIIGPDMKFIGANRVSIDELSAGGLSQAVSGVLVGYGDRDQQYFSGHVQVDEPAKRLATKIVGAAQRMPEVAEAIGQLKVHLEKEAGTQTQEFMSRAKEALAGFSMPDMGVMVSAGANGTLVGASNAAGKGAKKEIAQDTNAPVKPALIR